MAAFQSRHSLSGIGGSCSQPWNKSPNPGAVDVTKVSVIAAPSYARLTLVTSREVLGPRYVLVSVVQGGA